MDGQRAGTALAGETLQHGHIYQLNVMLGRDGMLFVDWPHAWIGAAHCDVLTLLSSASLSGLDPPRLADEHPLTRGLHPDRPNVFRTVQSGFLVRLVALAGLPADPNLPDMATASGRASLDWLRSRP